MGVESERDEEGWESPLVHSSHGYSEKVTIEKPDSVLHKINSIRSTTSTCSTQTEDSIDHMIPLEDRKHDSVSGRLKKIVSFRW